MKRHQIKNTLIILGALAVAIVLGRLAYKTGYEEGRRIHDASTSK